MLLSSTLALIASLAAAQARAVPGSTSILAHGSDAYRQLPIGTTPISRHDMAELARLAIAVNTAYCRTDGKLQPHPVGGLSGHDRPRVLDRAARRASSIIVSSEDEEYEHLSQRVDMGWYISHTPSTQTLTLAFSSLPHVDALLEVLASSPPSDIFQHALVPLPEYLFPQELIPFPPPHIHHSYLPELETHGVSALIALLDLLETPPLAAKEQDNVLQQWIQHLRQTNSLSAQPIRHVEIVGHGLGGAVALLVALALHIETKGPAATAYSASFARLDISATLFGLPRVGDQAFADWVDATVSAPSSGIRIHRVTSFADTVAHLPERHMRLAHPSSGEVWIGADPRTAYACRSETEGVESRVCAASIRLEKTSLLDHAGPYGGVWIGGSSCRRERFDVSAL